MSPVCVSDHYCIHRNSKVFHELSWKQNKLFLLTNFTNCWIDELTILILHLDKNPHKHLAQNSTLFCFVKCLEYETNNTHTHELQVRKQIQELPYVDFFNTTYSFLLKCSFNPFEKWNIHKAPRFLWIYCFTTFQKVENYEKFVSYKLLHSATQKK